MRASILVGTAILIAGMLLPVEAGDLMGEYCWQTTLPGIVHFSVSKGAKMYEVHGYQDVRGEYRWYFVGTATYTKDGMGNPIVEISGVWTKTDSLYGGATALSETIRLFPVVLNGGGSLKALDPPLGPLAVPWTKIPCP